MLSNTHEVLPSVPMSLDDFTMGALVCTRALGLKEEACPPEMSVLTLPSGGQQFPPSVPLSRGVSQKDWLP